MSIKKEKVKTKKQFGFWKLFRSIGQWVQRIVITQWLGKLKIGAKLKIGFVMVAVIAGVIGLAGTLNIWKIAQAGHNLYEMNVSVLGPLHKISTYFNVVRNNTLLYLEETSDAQRYESAIKTNEANVDNEILNLKSQAKNNERIIEQIEKLEGIFKDYWHEEEAVIQLVKENKVKEAHDKLIGSLGVLGNMADAIIDGLFEINDNDASSTAGSNYTAAFDTIWFMLAMVVVGMIVAVALGIALSRMISRPLQHLTAAAGQLADGNVNVTIPVLNSKDEIALLTSAFAKMVDSIREEAGVAAQIAKGNLDVTVNVKSEDDLLASSMTEVIRNLQALTVETGKLTAAASQGRLDVRGDAEGFYGEYRNVVEGFNHTLDVITAPLSEAGTVLKKMAANDYTTAMTGDYQGLLKEFSDQINVVQSHLLNVQDIFGRVAQGDISRLAEYQANGPRSQNDQLTPAIIMMMQAIQNLIDETGTVALAAARGELQVRGDGTKLTGKYQEIVLGINNMLDQMALPINGALAVLEEMAQGNLDCSLEGNYQGEYARIQDALNGTLMVFNQILGDINAAADQVASASRELSQGSQALSQGASEQAATIEELSATVETVTGHIKQNAAQANQTVKLVNSTKENANHGNAQMGEMLTAIRQIDAAAVNIGKIIKAIDEIAFQTNILALNAAVEAARAGQYGKGFAVVAEEVRNLAGRSARAAKETAELIESSIRQTAEGARMANQTAASLEQIVVDVTKSVDLVSGITTASNEQATAIDQINQGINQVAQVTQANTATAEESAASSEELLQQAENLRDMVGRFNLKSVDQLSVQV